MEYVSDDVTQLGKTLPKCRVRELDLSPLRSKTVVGNSDKIFPSSGFPGFPQKGANIQSPMIG